MATDHLLISSHLELEIYQKKFTYTDFATRFISTHLISLTVFLIVHITATYMDSFLSYVRSYALEMLSVFL
jgi:hypothetical protein